jgi:hypothetical protein
MQGFPKQTLGLMLIRFKRLAIDFLLGEERPLRGFSFSKLEKTHIELISCPEPLSMPLRGQAGPENGFAKADEVR